MDLEPEEVIQKIDEMMSKFQNLSESELMKTIFVKQKTEVFQDMNNLSTSTSWEVFRFESWACAKLLLQKEGKLTSLKNISELVMGERIKAEAELQKEDIAENKAELMAIEFKFSIPMLQDAVKQLIGKKLSEDEIRKLFIDRPKISLDPRESKYPMAHHQIVQFCLSMATWMVDPKELLKPKDLN